MSHVQLVPKRDSCTSKVSDNAADCICCEHIQQKLYVFVTCNYVYDMTLSLFLPSSSFSL